MIEGGKEIKMLRIVALFLSTVLFAAVAKLFHADAIATGFCDVGGYLIFGEIVATFKGWLEKRS